jgi:cysteine-rich repeat protein
MPNSIKPARAGFRFPFPTKTILATALAALFAASASTRAEADPRYYDRGTPTVQDIWVDPVAGNNANSGATRPQAVRTLTEAWSRVPMATTLTTTGYRIRLVAGTYLQADVPNYFESRWGTFAYPVILEAADGAGTADLPALNIYDCRYLYLLGLDVAQGGGDVLHCELCDHFLMNQVTVRGADPATYNVQEGVKVNQSQHVYIEDSDVSGAWDNAIDFVGVQYGHIQGNRIHDAGDWCLYTKGGSAYFRIEGNEFYDCGNGGFTAGQGTGFEFMTSPWLHYEAYDIRFVNNVIHDTDGAGMGVNGGYNILLAYNTLYRIGSISHILELVFGLRGCDGNTAQCSAYLAAGGWGISGSGEEPIPNRNVFVYNNVFYNPAPFQSQWQHLAIYGPRTTSVSSNIPSPARTDTNAQLRGNVIWNGPGSHALGLGPSEGCLPSNPTCNETQILADNAINAFQPQFVNAAGGDFHPSDGGNLYSATTFALPSFPGGDLPTPPVVPPGDLANAVTRDFSGAPRSPTSPPGAFGADCSSASCGDGTVTLGCESCDDHNLDDGDGCDSNCTLTACGNGIATDGEDCDDGNASSGDGCDANCTLTACGNGIATSGEACDDGNLANGDGCEADCTLGCAATPSPSCLTASRARASKLQVVDAPGTEKDLVKWTLKRASSTALGTFGEPTASTGYLFCLYQTVGGSPSVALEAAIPSAADCGTPGCWVSRRTGYRYLVTTAGKVGLNLTAKSTGLGDLVLTAKGSPAFSAALPLGQDTSVTAQMRNSAGECWSAVFTAPASRNDAGRFKDTSD